MSDIKITTIQTELFWEDSKNNINQFNKTLKSNELGDIVVLPEMFTTGFTMKTDNNAELMDGNTVLWMKEKAKEYEILLIGSLIIKEGKNYYNRLITTFPNGDIKYYDKRHLFRMANEHEYYTSGKQKLIFNYKGWNICPLICYDLRFPVWSRNTNNETDLYLYIANWPKARVSAWSKLLRARAIENLAYVVGVNRIGKDGKDIDYSGGSAVIDFKGDDMYEHPNNFFSVHTTQLSKKDLIDFREKFAANLDADKFNIEI